MAGDNTDAIDSVASGSDPFGQGSTSLKKGRSSLFPAPTGTDTTAAPNPQVVASQSNSDGSTTHLVHVPPVINKAVQSAVKPQSSSTAMPVAPESGAASSGQQGAAADGVGNGSGQSSTTPPRVMGPFSLAQQKMGMSNTRPSSEAQSTTPAAAGTPGPPDATSIQAGDTDELAKTVAGQDNTTLPTLKPQGGESKIARFFSRFTGTAGPTPEAGEKYTGPTNPTELTASEKASPASKALGVLGRVGNAAMAVGGTPEQKQIAEQREEFVPKTQLELQALKNEQQYRSGVLANQAGRNDINQQKADEAKRKDDAAMQAKGYVPSPAGGYRAMTEDEILANPQLSQNQELRSAAIISKQMGAELAKAHADALNNIGPDGKPNPTYAQREREIQSRMELARANMQVARGHLELAAENQAMAGQRDLLQLGRNTQTGEIAGQGPTQLPPTMMTDTAGNPVPYKGQSIYAPTVTMRNASAQAQIVKAELDPTIAMLKANADQIGPVMGRWNQFTQSQLGLENPSFAALQGNQTMMATALALAHARGRLPDNLRVEFDKMIKAPQQSPENLIATLEGIAPWVDDMVKQGRIPEYGEQSASAVKNALQKTPTTPIHNAAAAGAKKGGVPTFSEFVGGK